LELIVFLQQGHLPELLQTVLGIAIELVHLHSGHLTLAFIPVFFLAFFFAMFDSSSKSLCNFWRNNNQLKQAADFHLAQNFPWFIVF
jgi:hypothetical protein